MSSNKHLTNLIKEHKTVFIIIAVGLFLIELEIFAVAALKSGADYRLQVMDENGNLIHETDGKNLSDFNKYYFEKTFGSFENYQVKLVKTETPFPFRAWFVAAVGVPIGIVLLFAFVFRAYTALFFQEEEKRFIPKGEETHYHTRMERIIASINRFNIFTIGFLVLLGVLLYWIIPNFAAYIGQVGIDTLIRFKWFFLVAAVMGFVVVVWVIYLKFQLAKKAIDSQVEVDKYRMKLEFQYTGKTTLNLGYQPEKTGDVPLVSWQDISDSDHGSPSASTPESYNGRSA